MKGIDTLPVRQLSRAYQDNHRLIVIDDSLQMPEVVENQGRVAIVRGPLVYALEDQDNGFDVHTTRIGADVPLVTPAPAGLDGVVSALAGATQDGLPYTAIPYYAWANRGRSTMEVWLHR